MPSYLNSFAMCRGRCLSYREFIERIKITHDETNPKTQSAIEILNQVVRVMEELNPQIPMMRVARVKEQIGWVWNLPITTKNYREVAAIIQPPCEVDYTAATNEFIAECVTNSAAFPEFQEVLYWQKYTTQIPHDLAVACVLTWQYNAALLRAYSELREFKPTLARTRR